MMSRRISISLDNIPQRSSLHDGSQKEGPPVSPMSDRSTQQGPDDEVLDPMRSQKSTRSKPSLWDRLVTNWWGFEIAGWLLATLSTAVMIIVFALFDQHAVDSWHSGVTPNALLQVLSQIVQTAMLPAVAESISQLKWLWFHNSNLLGDMPAYADASTGPFATILLVLKRRRVPLVYLAAISSWLVLLYGAFAQQALQQPLREVHDGIGSIPIALIYQASNSTRQRYSTSNCHACSPYFPESMFGSWTGR